MTEQDKKYVIEALEYALNKCIDVNGNSETHYNTLVNAIELVDNCSIPCCKKLNKNKKRIIPNTSPDQRICYD